jgi:hypothetical protein
MGTARRADPETHGKVRLNGATLLHRQVNPSWVQQGRVTSQVFKPTPKDNRRLSVYDGDQVSAFHAWLHYTTELGLTSIGVLAVTVAECETLDLEAVPDPAPFPAHAVIKFDACTPSQIEKKAKRLKAASEARGWLHQAESGL